MALDERIVKLLGQSLSLSFPGNLTVAFATEWKRHWVLDTKIQVKVLSLSFNACLAWTISLLSLNCSLHFVRTKTKK